MPKFLSSVTLALLSALAVPSQAAVFYSNDFEVSAAGMSGAGFLAPTQGYSAYGFGSQYFRNSSFGNPAASSVLGFSLGSAATSVALNFYFAAIDSWDGANCCGPDFFNVKVDGTTIYTKNFDIFGSPSIGPELTTLVYGPNLAVSGWGDQGYKVALSIGNLSAGAHTIEFFASGSGWQGGDDESFAIDNVIVSGDDGGQLPEPASLALCGLALLGAGAARRRRA
ncbi:MAG TPA: PEP-CTERM sorting domain-containing protein [Accumulibacter sp.]|uniref:PEP-CTERM sorting domain-containing protein n=1 Tax=Accumulibacter sp. TaxID=2053492 RepID=UPI0025EBF2DD|nr:PEP-CTERM sorting domain-containing protein [Accumulibacter sp.]MCM8597206.1 PEP-CTERM sorting domain-containing protein [Accumulibacter sp.]MCM8661450.1 PEP-CTERM sorting domain-containing protein [Accumulibacter sp.]HNC53180.1 PEP-CTERM sorting domain-containing protein [Accumulibacter sp.]